MITQAQLNVLTQAAHILDERIARLTEVIGETYDIILMEERKEARIALSNLHYVLISMRQEFSLQGSSTQYPLP